jgi:hypothetical protein
MGVGKVVTMLYPDYIYLTATGGQTPIYAERALVSAMSERHVRSVAQKIRDALHPDASLPLRVEISGVKIVLYARMRTDRLIIIAVLDKRRKAR